VSVLDVLFRNRVLESDVERRFFHLADFVEVRQDSVGVDPIFTALAMREFIVFRGFFQRVVGAIEQTADGLIDGQFRELVVVAIERTADGLIDGQFREMDLRAIYQTADA
jgi:hypothetical protein